MSAPTAIAAVTAALRSLLQRGAGPGVMVTTRSPDRAKEFGADDGDARVNLFLYQTRVNAAWRNMDPPDRTRPNERGHPSLPLDLRYLVTAYEKNDGDPEVRAHRALGAAMSTLHDHPLLGRDEIRAALPGSGVESQFERIRITPDPLSLEEISKLWATFQTEYRISASYEVSVVLIDSSRDPRAPLPVLSRGEKDEGVDTVPEVILPMIEQVVPPRRQSAALPGDVLTIRGRNLAATVGVEFPAARPDGSPDASPLVLAPRSATDKVVTVELAEGDPSWSAGSHTLRVRVPYKTRTWSSNELSFSLAPRIDDFSAGFVHDEARREIRVTVKVSCTPDYRLDQPTFLLLEPMTSGAEPLVVPLTRELGLPEKELEFAFTVPETASGRYVMRLRISGADLPVVDFGTVPPSFKTILEIP